jgi:hypothetical protein
MSFAGHRSLPASTSRLRSERRRARANVTNQKGPRV